MGEFAPYVQKFEDQASAFSHPLKVTNLIIRYGQMQSTSERGACEISGDETPLIVIRQDTWAVMPEAEREELLFHEMGHCVLGRAHNPQLTAYGMPASIMNPYIIQGYIYDQNRSYYLSELFGK